jgi:hypothetical protein
MPRTSQRLRYWAVQLDLSQLRRVCASLLIVARSQQPWAIDPTHSKCIDRGAVDAPAATDWAARIAVE